jgi:Spy/CpxP family protein refolding chaperone
VSYWKPILAALVIFAAGVVTGGLTLDLGTSKPDERKWSSRPNNPGTGGAWQGRSREARERHLSEVCSRMAHDLGLSEEQRDRIEGIIRDTHEKVRAMVDEISPGTRNAFKEMEEAIKAELTPEQVEKFEEINKRRQRAFRGPDGPRRDSPESSNQPPPDRPSP